MQRGLANGIDPQQARSWRNGMMQGLNATGQFVTETVKAKGATQAFTESLLKQDATFLKSYRSRQLFNEALREQYKLQRMTTVQWTKDARGGMTADVIVPKGVSDEVGRLTGSMKENLRAMRSAQRGSVEYTQAVDIMRMRMAMTNQVIKSGADNMIKWGKNTQWAGRQLMVGFTVPFAAFAAVAGAAFFSVDQELTRIAKVYDTTTQVVGNNQQQMMAREQELAAVRKQSLDVAIQAAKRYGAAIDDTLKVEAELAATGLAGQDLMAGTAEVVRIATLGELDFAKATELSISLQNAFGLSIEDVTKKMDYMNSIENATSLSLADFAEATPRAATAMAQLGVTVEEMGILLVAMKERGVNAAQGANALKSATVRLLKPTDQAVETVRNLSNGMINLGELGRESGGNLFKALDMIGDKMEGLSDIKKQQIIANLFGTYQFNRLNAALVGVSEKTGQVARAMDVASQSSTEWASTAAREINEKMSSASGRFKAAVQQIKGELAKMGEPFLQFATFMIDFTRGILSFFNAMPKGVKVAIIAFFGLMAVAGPLIMITGLMSNMIGQVLKLTSNMAGFAMRLKLVSTEQKIQEMLSKSTSAMWQNQGLAAAALNQQLRLMTTQMERTAIAQTAMAKAAGVNIGAAAMVTTPGAGGAVVTGSSNVATRKTQYKVDNRFASPNDPRVLGALGAADAHTRSIEQNSAKASRNWGGIAMGTALAAGVMGGLVGGSSTFVSNLSTALIISSLIGPQLLKITRVGAAARGLGTAFGRVGSRLGMSSQLLTRMGGGIARMGPMFMGALGPAVAVVGTIGALWWGVHRSVKKTREEQEKLNKSAKNWADVLGFVYQEQAKLAGTGDGNAKDSMETLSAKLSESNKPLAEQLRMTRESGNQQRLLNMAIEEGVKARRHGASAAQAEQAVQLALFTAGVKNIAELEAMMADIKIRINFESEESMMRAQAEGMAEQFTRIANNKFKQGKMEGFGRVFSGRDELNAGAVKAAEGVADEFWNTWQAKDQQGRRVFFEQFSTGIRKEQAEAFGGLSDSVREQAAKFGLTTMSELAAAYKELTDNGMHAFNQKYGADAAFDLNMAISPDDIEMLKKYGQAEMEIAQKIARANGLRGDELKQIRTLAQVSETLSQARMSEGQALSEYNAKLNKSESTGMKLNGVQRLALLNSYRAAAGKKAATSIEQGFTDALDEGTKALQGNADALADNYYEASEFASAYGDATKAAMSGAQGFALDYAESLRSSNEQATLDAIQRRGEKRSEALEAEADRQADAFDGRAKTLDKRWKGIMDDHDDRWKNRIENEKDGYDDRIKKIKDTIDAEQKAEDARERMFEAEKTRIERLANIANQRIDFNFALNSGNLDEAAKVFNDISSQQDTWALDDAAAGSGDAFAARKEAAEGQIDKLEEQRDARIDALKKIEDAEKEALEAKKEREKEALDAEKERYDKGLDAQKKKIAAETKNAEDAARRDIERRKRTLELELQTIRASVPRNTEEYNRQIAQIEAAYSKYGVNLKAQGNDWSNVIGAGLKANVSAAAASLQNEINWRQLAAEITAQFTEGAFGLDPKEFADWITTGKLPAGGLTMPAATSTGSGSNNRATTAGGSSTRSTRHTGGRVDKSMGSRAGVPASAARFPSEVDTRLRVGEYVVQKSAVNKYGTDFMAAINDGEVPTYHKGGSVLGQAGVLGAGMVGMMSTAIRGAMMAAAARKMGGEPTGGFGTDGGTLDLGGGLQSPDRFAPWLTPVQRRVEPSVMARVGAALAQIPGGQTITSGLRPGATVKGTNRPSLHGIGKAVDIGVLARARGGTAQSEAEGDAIADIFRSGKVPGVSEVLWKTMQGGDHFNHVHVGFRHKGGPIESSMTKGLKGGGYTLGDGYAKLHRSEAVLTAPLTQQLKDGIGKIDQAGNTEYTVMVDLRGSLISSDVDIQKAINTALDKRESKMGRSRSIR